MKNKFFSFIVVLVAFFATQGAFANNCTSENFFTCDEINADKEFFSNIASPTSKEQALEILQYHPLAEDGTEKKEPNLKEKEWKKFDAAVGRETTPEELLHYIYGVLHSPAYRERYKEFLKIDFPRIPLPANEDEFVRKGEVGRQLIDLHLMHDSHTWQLTTTFPEAGDCMVDRVTYKDGRVMINATQYFGNVPAEAWNAYIGGYQPAQKWLKDRKGRTLTYDDIEHYRKIIHALTETQRLMKTIC